MYMDDHKLSPDQLIAKGFRLLQSSRPRYKPDSKAGWAAEIQKIYLRESIAGLQRLQKDHSVLYGQRIWIFAKIDDNFRYAGF
jgi:hypothetical protein